MRWIVCGLAGGCGVLLADRFGLWLERRGWIFYRTRSSSGGARTAALLSLQSVFEPDKEHVVTAERQEQLLAEEDDSGDPPSPRHPDSH